MGLGLFVESWILVIVMFLLGVGLAWLIWGRNDNA